MAYMKGPQNPSRYPYVGPNYNKWGDLDQYGLIYDPLRDAYVRDAKKAQAYREEAGLQEKEPKQPGLGEQLVPIVATAGAIEVGKELGPELVGAGKEALGVGAEAPNTFDAAKMGAEINAAPAMDGTYTGGGSTGSAATDILVNQGASDGGGQVTVEALGAGGGDAAAGVGGQETATSIGQQTASSEIAAGATGPTEEGAQLAAEKAGEEATNQGLSASEVAQWAAWAYSAYKIYDTWQNKDTTDEAKVGQTAKQVGLAVASAFTGGLAGLAYAGLSQFDEFNELEKNVDEFHAKYIPGFKPLFRKSGKQKMGERINWLQEHDTDIPSYAMEAYNNYGLSKDDLIAREQGQLDAGTYGNTAFAESRDEKDLTYADVWGALPWLEALGNDYLQTTTEDQRREMNKRALAEGLFIEERGQLYVTDNKYDRLKEIYKEVTEMDPSLIAEDDLLINYNRPGIEGAEDRIEGAAPAPVAPAPQQATESLYPDTPQQVPTQQPIATAAQPGLQPQNTGLMGGLEGRQATTLIGGDQSMNQQNTITAMPTPEQQAQQASYAPASGQPQQNLGLMGGAEQQPMQQPLQGSTQTPEFQNLMAQMNNLTPEQRELLRQQMSGQPQPGAAQQWQV